MKKVICLVLLFLLLSPALSECISYSEIGMDWTEDRFLSVFPDAQTLTLSDSDLYRAYRTDDGACAFFYSESGRMQAKSLYFETVSELSYPLYSEHLDLYTKLKLSASYRYVVELLGTEGVEIMRINESDAEDSPVKIIMIWAEENGNSLQAMFNSEMKLEYVNYSEK